MLNTKIKDYQIQSELGRGGMARVYLAHDNKFDTNVAIKVLNKEFVHNDNIRKRFLAEAKSMFKMSHPNIIKVNDLIEENDTVAFVMEYIEGETLKEYIDRKGKLKDEEIKNIFSQMLDAVGYVHEQNLVHRDIKPSNFMIDKKGKVKLMDFGIAKTLDASSSEYTQTGTGIQMGTPMYMSPEQITETKSVTAQSDIYSLGVVLWQLVTGQKPYDTNTLSSFQLQTKIVNDALTQTNTTWDAVIQKCTQKDIRSRFFKCAEISQTINTGSVKADSSDSTVLESQGANTKQEKPRSEINLEERFQQERERNAENNERGTSRIKWVLIVGVLVLLSALGYHFFIAGSGSSIATNSTKELVFKEVKIGNQIWMAENLNVSTFRNGDTIPESKNIDEFENMGAQNKPSWCYFDFDSSNGQKYGKLYNWHAVNDPRGLAPIGYHIPSDTEWTNLINFLGADRAGEKLKSTSGWFDAGNGSNESGFTGLPGGNCDLIMIGAEIGHSGWWWSATQVEHIAAMSLGLHSYNKSAQIIEAYKENGLSVRCIKD
ncbi:MAG: protein kinase domain-containing protein [Flavobacteriales bacterium]